jgi:hypothetical protein
MRIRDLFDPGSGMENFGSGINIPNPQPWCIYSLISEDMDAILWDSSFLIVNKYSSATCVEHSSLPEDTGSRLAHSTLQTDATELKVPGI